MFIYMHIFIYICTYLVSVTLIVRSFENLCLQTLKQEGKNLKHVGQYRSREFVQNYYLIMYHCPTLQDGHVRDSQGEAKVYRRASSKIGNK